MNQQLARTYSMVQGIQNGNGMIQIVSTNVGYQVDLKLESVRARDQQKPDKIEVENVALSVDDTDVIRIRWEKPEDRGTIYYHKAESYDMDTLEQIGISNVTVNSLVSGIRGYFYNIDTSSEGNYKEQEYRYTEQCQMEVGLTEGEQYLHIAAVDVAGNVGDITNIPLGTKYKGPDGVQWKLHTRALQIEQGDSVYPDSEEGIYYVKCDGNTPFALWYASYMDGPGSKQFQLNYSIVESRPDIAEPARNIVYIPSKNNIIQTEKLTAGNLGFQTEGISYIHHGNFTSLQRDNYGKTVRMREEFVPEKEADHARIFLFPIAGADTDQGPVYSERSEDEENGLVIICDGSAPEIHGMDILEQLPILDRRSGQITLQLTAEDALSGVKEFYVEIENQDNGAKQILYPQTIPDSDSDAAGGIVVDITEDIPIFSGDFTVTATAVDNVGNRNVITYTTLEFDLKTQVERILEPHEPEFKCGESGVLTIKTWGYAERLEIEFPEEMTQFDDSLNRIYEYELKMEYDHEESLVFQVPLYVPERTEYEIIVRAYKGDSMLEQHPALAVVGVSGTVLDELRTRLR